MVAQNRPSQTREDSSTLNSQNVSITHRRTTKAQRKHRGANEPVANTKSQRHKGVTKPTHPDNARSRRRKDAKPPTRLGFPQITQIYIANRRRGERVGWRESNPSRTLGFGTDWILAGGRRSSDRLPFCRTVLAISFTSVSASLRLCVFAGRAGGRALRSLRFKNRWVGRIRVICVICGSNRVGGRAWGLGALVVSTRAGRRDLSTLNVVVDPGQGNSAVRERCCRGSRKWSIIMSTKIGGKIEMKRFGPGAMFVMALALVTVATDDSKVSGACLISR